MDAPRFRFRKPGRLIDGDLELELVKTSPGDPSRKRVPSYEFAMKRTDSGVVVGHLYLRIGPARTLRYPGHVGYEVKTRCRGHHYAARSTRMILPLARAHGLAAVWLTVKPGNDPSIRTCQILGARYMGTVRVPATHPANYLYGMKYLRRYRLSTKEIGGRSRPARGSRNSAPLRGR